MIYKNICINDPELIADAYTTVYVMLFSYLLSVPALILFNAVAGTGNIFDSMKIMFITMIAYILYVIIFVIWLMNVAVSWTSEYVYICIHAVYTFSAFP